MKQKMCVTMLMLAVCWTTSLAFKLSGSNAPIKFSDSHNETSNKIIEEVVSENLNADMKDINGIPNPMGDNESENNETNEGFGDLARNLEFLLLKVAQLETVAEMHEARIETQQLQIDEHRKVIEAQHKEAECTLNPKKIQGSLNPSCTWHGWDSILVEDHMGGYRIL